MKKASRLTHWRGCVLLVLVLSLLIGACGPEPTPTPLPSTEVAAVSTATPVPPTDTREPTDTPTPALTDTPKPMPTPVARFEEAACPFELPEGQEEGETVECGYLVVPEDRADPESPDVRLVVAIFHPPGGAAEPDPILYLSGGPGLSDLEFLWLSFDGLFAPLLATDRDLVVFDQRGMGYSQPALDCPQVLQLGLELLDGELDGKQQSDQEAYDLALETTLACAEDLSAVANLSAYHTAASAADVNDLRLALGYGEVNLLGTSYGTRLALEVMRDYPAGVRSVVLDSVYPLDVDLYLEGPANADRAFEVLFEDCAADQDCNAAYPELRTVFFNTVDRLEETPASFQVLQPFSGERYDVLMDGDDLAMMVFGFLKMSDVLPSVPQIIHQATQDRFDLLASLFGVLMGLEEAVSHGMYYSVQCHDEYAFTSPAQFEETLADYPDWAALFEASPVGSFGLEVCAGWASGEAKAVENQAVVSDIPTLILAGGYDPTTPPAWGQRAAETLENSYFFEYPGIGHGVSAVAGCPQEMMLAFLDDPATAPDGACIAEMGPLQFVIAAEAGAVELEAYANEEMGIGGVIPAGWTGVDLGVYARAASAADAAMVLAQAAPVSAEELLALVADQLGLEGTPENVGQRHADGLTWTLYAVALPGLEIDMALTEASGLALIVLLQSEPEEHDALYEAVFLPVVDALAPIAQPAVEVADAFMTALKEGDYATAYELSASDLQEEFGSAEDLETWMVEHGIEPLNWSFLSRKVSDDRVELLGTATFAGDQEAPLEVVLFQVDGEWRVAGFHVG